ncbi:hypothetical protein [Bradyrhizobium sp.]|uniref:hypothetical protein n=1 Tax=Bradyrhizobium sp. TaxID=376 RepID=UPI003C7312D4
MQRFLDQFFCNGAQNAMIIAVADFHPQRISERPFPVTEPIGLPIVSRLLSA